MSINSKNNNLKTGVGLGVFDGCHLGHSELVYALVSESTKLGLIPSIFTFRRHPSHVTGELSRISDGILTNDEEKELILKEKGIDRIVFQEFTEEFSSYTPREFLDIFIKEKCNAGLIVTGFNFRFGKDRKGDTKLLRSWGEKNGIRVIIVDPVKYKGKTISSSAIRKSIRKGDISSAGAMLGRKYFLTGTVMPGQGLGSRLGSPTANLIPETEACVPGNGVYATRLICEGKSYDAVTNVGLRPSVPGRSETPICETFIIGDNVSLYGRKIKVEFWKRLRDEKKFDSLDDLKTAISEDISHASAYHADAGELFTLQKIDDIKIRFLKTTRFTTDILNIRMIMPLSKKTASQQKLLSKVLLATCSAYPSRSALSGKMARLYGADISMDVTAQGNALIIDMSADALHAWPDGGYSFRETAKLMLDMLGSPDLTHEGFFRSEIVESEKTGLISEIESRQNDKGQYAFDRSIEMYTSGTPYEARSFGDISLIKNESAKTLKKAYLSLMKDSQVMVTFAGRSDDDLQEWLIDPVLKIFRRNKPKKICVPGKFPHIFDGRGKTVNETDKREVSQARVCFIYEGKNCLYSPVKPVDILLNTVLGGDVDSLLFRRVREEEGLAYSVFSANLKYLNAIFMEAGVAPGNVPKAARAMMAQLETIKAGEIPENIIASSKIKIISSLKEVSDSLRKILSHALKMECEGIAVTPFDLANAVGAITKEELADAAKKYELAVEYVLTSEAVDSTGEQDI